MIYSGVIDFAQQGVLSPNTINKITQTLRTILSQAVGDGIVAANAVREVQPMVGTSEERGSFTMEELQRLLASTEFWPNLKHYATDLPTAATGMRIAEVSGRCLDALKPGEVSIIRSWEQKFGFKDPKCGSYRDLPLAADVRRIVNELIARTEPDNIVFYGRCRRDRQHADTRQSKTISIRQ